MNPAPSLNIQFLSFARRDGRRKNIVEE